MVGQPTPRIVCFSLSFTIFYSYHRFARMALCFCPLRLKKGTKKLIFIYVYYNVYEKWPGKWLHRNIWNMADIKHATEMLKHELVYCAVQSSAVRCGVVRCYCFAMRLSIWWIFVCLFGWSVGWSRWKCAPVAHSCLHWTCVCDTYDCAAHNSHSSVSALTDILFNGLSFYRHLSSGHAISYICDFWPLLFGEFWTVPATVTGTAATLIHFSRNHNLWDRFNIKMYILLPQCTLHRWSIVNVCNKCVYWLCTAFVNIMAGIRQVDLLKNAANTVYNVQRQSGFRIHQKINEKCIP